MMTAADGSYDLMLVVLSYIVAVFTSLTALNLSRRMHAGQGIARHLWLMGGAFSLGLGVWAMHFIGMLALDMPVALGYDIPMTVASLALAILFTALALLVIETGRTIKTKLGVGGSVMGVGIYLTYFVGMQAMQTRGTITYDPWLFSLSVVVAIVSSIAALWLTSKLSTMKTTIRSAFCRRGLAALVMGMAITGTHYTGMTAAQFPTQGMDAAVSDISSPEMAGMIVLVSVCIMIAALMMSTYDAHLSSKTSRLANSLKKANRELKTLVFQDQLTKLPNRMLLDDKLDDLLKRTGSGNPAFAIFFVDLDRFKTVNDSLGHHAGDELIKQAAIRLQAAVRETDTVARVGGDEFVVITSAGTRRKESAQIAQRIVSSLGQAFEIGNDVIRITSSIGISLYPLHGKDKDSLMIHADAAMYYAKDMGRNNFQFYKPGMSSVAKKTLRLESRLRLAVENNQLTLAYQPKVNVKTGAITGAEALLRWHDSELGNVPPDEIIPIAEDTGLILPIGEWVLRTACRQSQQWHEQGFPLLPMAVNLSAIQLNNRNFVTIVKNVLKETGFPPGHLELELTESAIMQNPDRASLIFKALRELGVTISIDDFGTGYSSFSQLKRFPITHLKIDRSFTLGVASDIQDAAIVKAVIAMAHSLNLETIVEGVENQDQLDFIRNLNAHQFQGFLCSKALAPDDFGAFLAARTPASA